jgi:hypothetical protein
MAASVADPDSLGHREMTALLSFILIKLRLPQSDADYRRPITDDRRPTTDDRRPTTDDQRLLPFTHPRIPIKLRKNELI